MRVAQFIGTKSMSYSKWLVPFRRKWSWQSQGNQILRATHDYEPTEEPILLRRAKERGAVPLRLAPPPPVVKKKRRGRPRKAKP